MTLWSYLVARMRPYAERIAFNDSRTTYGELLRFESPSSARRLRLCTGATREEQAIAVLRCIAEGDVAVPLSPEYGTKHAESIAAAVRQPQEPTDGLAFVAFTSGTTGAPKGVMLTDDNIVNVLENTATYFRLENCRTICIGRPLEHIAVLTGELLYALCNGLTVHFFEEPFMPKRLISFLTRRRIDVFCATPTLYRALAKAGGARGLRVGVVSGEVLQKSVGRLMTQAFPDTAFYNVYGLTEHGPRVSALPPDQFRLRPDSVGKPIGNVEVRIEDGELLVRSPCVMRGYYGDAAATAEKTAGGWLHTGDGAHFDGDGYLYIDGRKDDMIIRAGLNVYPETIEQAAKACGVDDCVAAGETTENGTRIVLRYTGSVDPSDLKKRLAAALPPSLAPNRIERVAAVARTPSGKKVRR